MSRLAIVRAQLIDQDRYKGDNFIMEQCPSAFRVGPGICSKNFYISDGEYSPRRSGCRGISCFECWNRSINTAAN